MIYVFTKEFRLRLFGQEWASIYLHQVPRNSLGFYYTWKHYAHHLLSLNFYWKAKKYNAFQINFYTPIRKAKSIW